jgi:hypothetical protein
MGNRDNFGWDYPAGVHTHMIPGCRPQDEEIDVTITITEGERKELEDVLDAGAHHESFPEILQRVLDSANRRKRP